MDSTGKHNSNKSGTVTKLAELVDYEEGSVVSKTILDRKSASVAVYAFDKFQEIVEHILPYDALFYVLEGEAEVEISGKAYIVKAGEMITFPANKPHSISTKCKFKMLLFSLKE
jgi:quercetin dioxygenase-like cupin family protein